MRPFVGCEPAAIFASADLSGQVIMSKIIFVVDHADPSCI